MSAFFGRSASPVADLERNEERSQQATLLYERFGKPLEPEHDGQFVAITPDGRIVLGSELLEAIQRASSTFGSVSFVFKVGEGVAGTWR